MKPSSVHRLEQETPIAVAIVHDHGSGLAPVPTALTARVHDALGYRNLRMHPISQPALESALGRKRATRDRLDSVAKLASEASLLLLVEMRAQYYSQIGGRYRWTVYVKLSLGKAGASNPVTKAFTIPILLSFDHEREQDALEQAAETIAAKLGKEVDDFITGLDMKTHSAASNGAQKLGPIYFVMLDRFYNGNRRNDGRIDASDPQAFHGGDIAGLTEKLDFIADMGFRSIWLSPIFSMRTEKIGEHGAFHGYWTEDLRELESRFGTTEELVALRSEVEKRGMNLVLDIVLNHVGYDTRFTREHPDWFHNNGDIKNWDDAGQLTTFDVHGLPDLDQDNSEVYEYLVAASAHWIDSLAPAGFRLDAVKHVGSRFWQRYTRELRDRGGAHFATIGELYNGDPSVLAKEFGAGGFSHLFDFPLYFAMKDTFCEGQHLGRLAATLSLDRLYDDATRLVTFADNHDVPRLWSACGGDIQRVQALLTFLLTARGIPAITYGTEAALAGASEPENRADMKFEKAPLEPFIGELLTNRRIHDVFHESRDEPLHLSEKHYSYLRVGETETALVAINLGKAPWPASAERLANAHGVDALTGSAVVGAPLVGPLSTRVVLYKTDDVRSKPIASEHAVVMAASDAEELLLVGAGPELGAWDPQKGVAGRKNESGEYEFTLDMPTSSVATFKFVRKTPDHYLWEQGTNRYQVVGGASSTIHNPVFQDGVQ